ncbi:hypothetical protein D3C80_2176710 [compost metagenome]
MPRGDDAGIELAPMTIGKNLGSHRFVEGSCADVLATQPLAAVKPEITFELSQLQ